MTRSTPRQRAHAALAVIDAHHDDEGSAVPWHAYTQLGEAMNQIYGSLPSEGLTLAHIVEGDGVSTSGLAGNATSQGFDSPLAATPSTTSPMRSRPARRGSAGGRSTLAPRASSTGERP